MSAAETAHKQLPPATGEEAGTLLLPPPPPPPPLLLAPLLTPLLTRPWWMRPGPGAGSSSMLQRLTAPVILNGDVGGAAPVHVVTPVTLAAVRNGRRPAGLAVPAAAAAAAPALLLPPLLASMLCSAWAAAAPVAATASATAAVVTPSGDGDQLAGTVSECCSASAADVSGQQ